MRGPLARAPSSPPVGGVRLMGAWRSGFGTDEAVVAGIRAFLGLGEGTPSQSEGETCLVIGAACTALGWAAEADAAFAQAGRVAGLEPLAASFAAFPLTAAEAWHALGVALRSVEALEGARAAFEQGVADGAGHPDTHMALAMTLIALGETRAAQRRLERMLELKPGD